MIFISNRTYEKPVAFLNKSSEYLKTYNEFFTPIRTKFGRIFEKYGTEAVELKIGLIGGEKIIVSSVGFVIPLDSNEVKTSNCVFEIYLGKNSRGSLFEREKTSTVDPSTIVPDGFPGSCRWVGLHPADLEQNLRSTYQKNLLLKLEELEKYLNS